MEADRLHLPVVDHHAHLHPDHEGIAAVRRFRRAGGTHLFLATQTYGDRCPMDLDGYRTQFETTEAIAAAARRDADVTAYVVVAPYPVDLLPQGAELGLARAVDLQRAALELAGRWVREHRAVALGEVGRPHFPVDPAERTAADEVFRYALETARDVDAPAVVHCEDLDAAGFAGLRRLAHEARLPPHRVVKHYARSYLSGAERAGLAASWLARRSILDQALQDRVPWFLETDFLDDPLRPGAVLDLATVPRRASALAAQGAAGEAALRHAFVDSVRTVYGWEPSVPEERAP